MKKAMLGVAALCLMACGGSGTTDDGWDGEDTAGGEEPACRLSETPIAGYRLPVLPTGYDLLEPRHREPWDQAQAVLGQSAPELTGEPTDESVQAYFDGPYTQFLSAHREALVQAETSLNELSEDSADVRAVASTVVGLMYYHMAVEMLRAPVPPRVASDPVMTAHYLSAIEQGVQPILQTVTDRAEYCVHVAASVPELHRWQVYCFALVGHAVLQAHQVHSMLVEAEEQAQSPEYIVRRWGSPRAGTNLGAHAQVQGNLNSDDVAHYVTSHQTPLLACYHRALDENEGLHGQLVLEFDIAADGTPGAITETVSTLGNAGLSNCVQTVFGGFHFPAPTEGTAHASVALDMRIIPIPQEALEGSAGAAESSTTPTAAE
ncbi:MAG: AgmX/PglI C-terminal domain-containing protein [Sandaracinaceae bacterium]|nr:AgmX/PglI C-terminal domain-containing protein [Sandaracinaceae bacterium]